MSDKPQVSVIVASPRSSSALECLCHSLTRQQNAPAFEVLVVCTSPNVRIERLLQNYDWRFRYICAEETESEGARETGLRVALGEIAVFIDSECRIDEPLFLRRHFEQHQRSTTAIGLSGRLTLSPDANRFQSAYFWLLDFWLSQARIDSLRCNHLCEANCSFKTERLGTFINSGPNDSGRGYFRQIALDAQLIAAGEELHLIDRLTVEYRPSIRLLGYLQKAFLHGRAQRAIEQKGLLSAFRFPGSRYSILSNLTERGGKMTRSLRLLFWIAGLGEQVGYNSPTENVATVATTTYVVRGVARLAWGRFLKLPYSRSATELFYALRFCIFRN